MSADRLDSDANAKAGEGALRRGKRDYDQITRRIFEAQAKEAESQAELAEHKASAAAHDTKRKEHLAAHEPTRLQMQLWACRALIRTAYTAMVFAAALWTTGILGEPSLLRFAPAPMLLAGGSLGLLVRIVLASRPS